MQEYLYGKATKSLSYNDFVNKELVQFSNSDNERSLACLVDGESLVTAVEASNGRNGSHCQ